MSGLSWTDRPVEHARLLNPAFLGALLWSCSKGYGTTDEEGLPYALSFVAMPLVLHKTTRELLPRSTRTSLATWLSNNTQVHVGFSERAAALVPMVKDALLFGSNGGLLEISSVRVIARTRPRAMARLERGASDEVKSCMKKAEMVGKWFASSGDYTTVMALWGVAP